MSAGGSQVLLRLFWLRRKFHIPSLHIITLSEKRLRSCSLTLLSHLGNTRDNSAVVVVVSESEAMGVNGSLARYYIELCVHNKE